MIEPNTPGPWKIDNGLSNIWRIVNIGTGRTKVIGKVQAPRSRSKVNYFDRANEEASRRNKELAGDAPPAYPDLFDNEPVCG